MRRTIRRRISSAPCCTTYAGPICYAESDGGITWTKPALGQVLFNGSRANNALAIPLADLGLRPAPGMKLAADLGVTYGNPAGDDTVLRSYWNNQATDFVADEVWELKLEPRNWGWILLE